VAVVELYVELCMAFSTEQGSIVVYGTDCLVPISPFPTVSNEKLEHNDFYLYTYQTWSQVLVPGFRNWYVL